MGDRNEGLQERYIVARVDGSSVGRCFVLELDDENSWLALLIWAYTLHKDGYETMAHEVRQEVREKVKNAGHNYPDWLHAQMDILGTLAP